MAETRTSSSIKFYFEKSKLFRVVHVDGAIGGLTPSRDIFVSLYNQRSALPQIIEQALSPEGKLGAVIGEPEGKKGIFREMEVGVVMTPEVAQQVAEFLLKHVKVAQESAPKEIAKGKIQ